MSRLGAALLIVLSLALSACSPTFRNHGYVPPDDELERIVVGVDNRESVSGVVGQPGATGLLTGGNYFYVRSRWQDFGYRPAKLLDRQVVSISFDEAGIVSNVERFGIEKGRVIALSRRVTDSNVQGVSFLKQLFGNLGQLTAADFLEGR